MESNRDISNLVLKSALDSPSKFFYFYSPSYTAVATAMEYSPTVIVPQSTKSLVVKKLVEEGAKMVQTGQTWFETDSHLRKEILGHDLNGAYVLPFGCPLI
ncbi:uncharacterized protein L203_102010 [Cryptococcus depauperatus CBS 7841]|uniref:Uncharacterized protein n=1 Tax=Cryptococcus depauperatus CBS 7841 TaxID=1295531 RepID=A0AAJ8M0P5_9TREE